MCICIGVIRNSCVLAFWHSELIVKQSVDIERVQKVAVNIILCDFKSSESYFSYDMALAILDLEPLSVRRDKLSLTFAKRTLNSRHPEMFKPTLIVRLGKSCKCASNAFGHFCW